MDIENNKTKDQEELPAVTPRQALIYAALVGWNGDEPSPWISPISIEDIFAWANSHLHGTVDSLIPAFEKLEAEGLFFEIHKGLFDPSCYFCSYRTDFLKEIPDGEDYTDCWGGFSEDYDERYGFKTWRALGLCAGQGSQGPSDASWGPCLGSSCCWFKDSSECNHGLEFKIKKSDK